MKEISDYYNERSRITLLIQKHSALLQIYEQRCNSVITEKQNLIKKLSERPIIQQPPQLPVPPPPVEDIPVNAWVVGDIPRELAATIFEVARNGSIPLVTKLRDVIGLIVRFYKNLLSENERSVKMISAENNGKLRMVERFLSRLGAVVCDSGLCLEHFESDPLLANEVIDKVQRLKQANIKLTQEKASSEESLLLFFMKLGVDSLGQAMNEIDRIIKALDGLEQKLRRERSRNRKLAKLLRQIEFAFREKETQLKTQFETQECRMQTLSEANLQLTGEIERNRKVIEQLNTEVASLMSSHTQAIEEKTREFGESMRGINDEMQRQRDDLLAQVSNRTDEFTKLKYDLQQTAEEVHRWKKLVKQLKKAKDTKEKQLQEAVARLTSRESELLEKSAREKQALRENYERLLEQLKGKNQAMRKFVDSTTSDLADCESRLKGLSVENSALVIERNQLALKVETQREEIKRERQLLDTKMKAVELDLQMQMQASVEEQKAKSDNEKRETFSIVANAFRQFFDPRNLVDTKYVQSIVERASSDLTKLQRQDAALRKIVGVGTSDCLEGAITKILLSAYDS
jgi:hypothetical protein